jgi:hypothetical protein
MLPSPQATLYFTDLDAVILAILVINGILLFTGFGRFALFNAIDSVFYLFFPKLALKFDHRKYFPSFMKNKEGETMKAFRTPRDEFYPAAGPLYERIGDFLLRFPFFSLSFFLLIGPFFVSLYAPYFKAVADILHKWYPGLPTVGAIPSATWQFRLFIILFFLPFSSLHTAQVSIHALILAPFAVLRAVFYFAREAVPPVFCSVCFLVLFLMEITLIYTGFLPLFHQGAVPFLESGPGLKQFIFWSPIKFKIFVDMIPLPVVVVVPLITTIGSYILAKHGDKEGDNNYIILFYKTGIAYFYAPLLSRIFPRLGEESVTVRQERRINEILVMGMYLESFVCIAGTGYAYYSLAQTNHVPFSGIFLGILILFVFVPLIVFSSNGFQSFFLDKSLMLWNRILEKVAFLHSKGTVHA